MSCMMINQNRNVVNNPHTTSPAINKANGNPATAFFRMDGSHVIIDSITLDVIQVSNIFDPGLSPDSSITNPLISGG